GALVAVVHARVRGPVAGADQRVHGAVAAEVEAAVEADAGEIDRVVAPTAVGLARELAGRDFHAQQRHRTGLPAVAGAELARGLVDVLVHPALAGRHADEGAAAAFFVGGRAVGRFLRRRGLPGLRRHRGIAGRLRNRRVRHALGRILLSLLRLPRLYRLVLRLHAAGQARAHD